MDWMLKLSDLLEVRTVVIVSVEFGKFRAVADVFRVHSASSEMRVELRGEDSDTIGWESLQIMQTGEYPLPDAICVQLEYERDV